MTPVDVIRPNKTVFVLRPLAWTAAFAALIGLIATFLLYQTEGGALVTVPGVVVVLLCAFVYMERSVAFSKTRYEIHDDRLVHKTGLLLADRTTSLPFRNVTQLQVRLPWIEHLIYSTGHLSVHAAGSSKGRVKLSCVDEPERIYDALTEALRRNGFSLRRDEITRQTRPHVVGAFIDTFAAGSTRVNWGGAALFTLGVFALPVANYAASDTPLESVVFVGGIAVLAAGTLGGIAIRFLDLKARVYTLWDDVVDYEDGFLTRTKKLIPVANLADTHVEKTLLKRIFGMADIVVSCQGDSGDIDFPSTPEARQFCHRLDELIRRTDRPTASAPEGSQKVDGTVDADEIDQRLFEPPELTDTAPAAESTRISVMTHALSSMFGSGLVVLGLVVLQFGSAIFDGTDVDAAGILCLVGGAVGLLAGYGIATGGFQWLTRTFTFGPRSVSSAREVITQKDTTEFSSDKVTAVVIARNPVHRLLKSATVKFHSIGHDEVLKFPHMPDYARIRGLLGQRFGLPTGAPERRIEPSPSFISILAAGPVTTAILIAIAAAGGIGQLWVSGAVWAVPVAIGALIAYVLYKGVRARFFYLEIYDHYLMLKSGIFFQKFAYIPIHQARNIATVEYPGTTTGRLEIESGGAHASFSIAHIDDLDSVHDRLDEMLYRAPPRPVTQPRVFDTDDVDDWCPQARNAIIKWSALSIVSVVGIPLLPVTLWYLDAYYKRADDRLQNHRLLQHRGLLYRRRATVLKNRVDQVQSARNPLHTICQNGIVEIYTLGGGGAELTFGPHPEFEAIDEAIQRQRSSPK